MFNISSLQSCCIQIYLSFWKKHHEIPFKIMYTTIIANLWIIFADFSEELSCFSDRHDSKQYGDKLPSRESDDRFRCPLTFSLILRLLWLASTIRRCQNITQQCNIWSHMFKSNIFTHFCIIFVIFLHYMQGIYRIR